MASSTKKLVDFIVTLNKNAKAVVFSSYVLTASDTLEDPMSIYSKGRTYMAINSTFSLSQIANLSQFFSTSSEFNSLS
jgi:ABC-type Na+ transport system ATPase subunit NatA